MLDDRQSADVASVSFHGPHSSLGGPCEECHATLVPDVLWDALSWDVDSSDQVSPLLVEVDWDLDLLSSGFRIELADVHPLDVHQG